MFKRKLHFLILIIILFFPFDSAKAQQAAANVSTDEPVLRALVLRYFELYAKKDIDMLVSLWSAQSPIIVSRREMWQRRFPGETYQFSQPVISRIRTEGKRGFARVATERTIKRQSSDANGVILNKTEMRVEYTFVNEDGQWKFFSEASATMGLFGDLQSAKTDAERERLLAEDPFLVTRELLYQLSSQSDFAYTSGQHDRAMNLLLAARMVAGRIGDKKEEANAWSNIGIIHFVKLRYQEAIEAYKKSLALNEGLGRKSEFARTLTSLGLVHTSLGKYPIALDYFRRGLSIHEELNEKGEVSRTLDNIGNLYYEQGDYRRASEYFQKSLDGLETPSASGTLISRLIKVARTEYEQGNDAAAIRFYERSLAKMEEAGIADNRGFVLHNIANIYYSQGDYSQALYNYLKGQKAQEVLGNKQGEMSAMQGIALIHSINGNHTLALEAYQRNLDIAQMLNDRAETAAAQSKVGGSLYSLGNLPESIEAFQKALTLREELGDPQDIAFSLLDLGVAFFAQNDFANALDRYSKSRALYEAANNPAGIATVLLNEALVFYAQQDYERTLNLANEAAALAKAAGDNDLYWQSRHRAGKSFFKLNNLGAARQVLDEAITVIETSRAQPNKSNQPRFYENRLAPYLAMVDVLIALKQGNEAFNYAERAKSRSLLGVVKSGKIWINKTMTGVERMRESWLLTELTLLTAQLARETEKKEPNKSRQRELYAALEKARKEYEIFRDRLYTQHPTLKVMRGEGKSLDIRQAILMANNPKTALLDFFETDERIYLFAFAKNSITKGQRRSAYTPLKIYLIDINRGELAARIEGLNQSIAKRDLSYEAQARELFDVLLKPAHEQLIDREHLIIIPDGVLWGLSFNALRTTEGRFLIEEFALSCAPSLTALAAISRARAGGVSGQIKKTQAGSPLLLAVGDATLNARTLDRIKPFLGTDQVAPQTGSQNEVEELALLYGKRRSVVLTGTEANEERLKAEAGKFRIFHFASRGFLSETAPLYSLVALATSEGSNEDGLLELREVIGLDLKADLAVFSNAELLMPQAGAGRSLTAFCWAFYIAGCPATLVGQWRVDSPALSSLMVEFHRALRASKSTKPSSWQTAVKRLLEGGEYRHPYFWAGFELMGDPR